MICRILTDATFATPSKSKDSLKGATSLTPIDMYSKVNTSSDGLNSSRIAFVNRDPQQLLRLYTVTDDTVPTRLRLTLHQGFISLFVCVTNGKSPRVFPSMAMEAGLSHWWSASLDWQATASPPINSEGPETGECVDITDSEGLMVSFPRESGSSTASEQTPSLSNPGKAPVTTPNTSTSAKERTLLLSMICRILTDATFATPSKSKDSLKGATSLTPIDMYSKVNTSSDGLNSSRIAFVNRDPQQLLRLYTVTDDTVPTRLRLTLHQGFISLFVCVTNGKSPRVFPSMAMEAGLSHWWSASLDWQATASPPINSEGPETGECVDITDSEGLMVSFPRESGSSTASDCFWMRRKAVTHPTTTTARRRKNPPIIQFKLQTTTLETTIADCTSCAFVGSSTTLPSAVYISSFPPICSDLSCGDKR